MTWLLLVLILITGCNKNSFTDPTYCKENFLRTVLSESLVDEGPFRYSYDLKTVYFSSEVVSLFAEVHCYTHLPHGSARYEGMNYRRINGRMKAIPLDELLTTPTQKEFVRSYCERDLVVQGLSYLLGPNPMLNRLDESYIRSYVLDHQHLIIFFQPYAVGGLADGPFVVKMPYHELLKNNPSPALAALIQAVTCSPEFVSSWGDTSITQDGEF
jgi:hypothetical protein